MTAKLPQHIRLGQVRECAEAGLTRREIAEYLGISRSTIASYCFNFSIQTKRDAAGWKPTTDRSCGRAEQMASLYAVGYTLQQIGDRYGITRERVRQLLRKHTSIERADGGYSMRAAANKRAKEAKREATSVAKHGCSYADYAAIRDLKVPTRAFASQRKNADRRGIEWQLTLWEWWTIWQQSGRWSQRGRGQGYVMSRIGDSGGYAVGNVYITTAIENTSEGQARKKKDKSLPIGVTRVKSGRFGAARFINSKHYNLGTFATPEAAKAAWIACGNAVLAGQKAAA